MASSFNPSSGRGVAAGIVAVLHVGLIYALTHLKTEAPPPAPQLLQVAILAERQPSSPSVVSPPPPKLVMAEMPSIEPPVLDLPDLPAPERAIQAVVRASSTPPTESSAAPAPILVSEVQYVRQPRPRYPEMSRRMHEHGVVVIMALINERGEACHVDVHRSSGYERLDKAAREAVADAMFKPYMEGGVARPFRVVIPVEFGFQRVAQR